MYSGHFSKGQKNGSGVEISKDGTRMECIYKDGKKEGPFVETDANGNVIRKGTYKNDRLQP